jgi:hypothetical protein
MQLDEVKTAVTKLTIEERRKLALYILELEKEHVQKTIGPQISEDLESVSRAVQEGLEKLKQFVKKG